MWSLESCCWGFRCLEEWERLLIFQLKATHLCPPTKSHHISSFCAVLYYFMDSGSHLTYSHDLGHKLRLLHSLQRNCIRQGSQEVNISYGGWGLQTVSSGAGETEGSHLDCTSLDPWHCQVLTSCVSWGHWFPRKLSPSGFWSLCNTQKAPQAPDSKHRLTCRLSWTRLSHTSGSLIASLLPPGHQSSLSRKGTLVLCWPEANSRKSFSLPEWEQKTRGQSSGNCCMKVTDDWRKF